MKVLAALALFSVAAFVVVRRGRCDTCGGWICPVRVAGLEPSER